MVYQLFFFYITILCLWELWYLKHLFEKCNFFCYINDLLQNFSHFITAP